MKRKIVVHTGNISIGGQEKMLIEFLKVLSPKKYEVYLYIEENKGQENYYEKDIPSHVKYEFLTEYKFMEKIKKQQTSKNFFSKLLYSINLKKKKRIAIKILKKKLKNERILIDYDMGLLRYLDKLKNNNLKIVGWSHAGKGEKIQNKRKNKNISYYDYIIAVNDVMRAGYLKNYGNKGINILKIENFLDIDLIRKLGNEKIEEKYLGKYIVSIGSLTENKNHLELLKGFKNYLDKEIEKINLVIIGEGKEREILETYIEENGLKNRVFLLGNKKNPYCYLKNSIGYIHSSKEESFGLVIGEAMVFSKWIIGKRNIGVEDILENGKHGLILENLEEKLPEILTMIFKDKNKEKELEEKSKNGLKKLEIGKFKVEEFIEKICLE